MEQTGKHILILAHRFYGNDSPGALRRRYFSQAALSHFSKVLVLEGNGDNSGNLNHPNNFQYTSFSYKDMRQLSRGGRQTEATKTKRRLGFLRKLFHSFPFLLWFGDGGPAYLRKAYVQACQLIEKENIHYVFSSYGPWIDHRLARKLKRRYPNLIWIADFRDLPIDPIRRNVLIPALQRWWAKRVVRKADIVTTVSEGLARRLHRLHPKVWLLRNAMPALPAVLPSAPMGPKFQISYTGSLYPRLQSARMLLNVLRDLSSLETAIINPARFELVYAGKDADVWEKWTHSAGIPHLSKSLGQLPLDEARSLQNNSQFNVLLTWSAPGYGGVLSAKLYDYMASGRPIIAIVNGPIDPELNQIINNTSTGRVFSTQSPADREALSQWIKEAYQTWQFVGAFPWAVRPDKLGPYSWPQQMAQFVDLLPKPLN